MTYFSGAETDLFLKFRSAKFYFTIFNMSTQFIIYVPDDEVGFKLHGAHRADRTADLHTSSAAVFSSHGVGSAAAHWEIWVVRSNSPVKARPRV